MGDAVVDVGANTGMYTTKYADRVGPTGAVYAVEPHGGAVAVLRERCVSYPWVVSWELALADTAGVRSFWCANGDSQRSSFWRENLIPREKPPQCWDVAVTTMDAFLMCLPRQPHLIKLDAQGAEGAILRGATETLRKPITWAVELWPMGLEHAGDSVPGVLEMFASRGFTPCQPDGSRWSWAGVIRAAAEQRGHGSIDVVCKP